MGKGSDAEVMMLNEEQLKNLAKLIHYQETSRIKSTRFGSEKERAQYLRDSHVGYQNTMELIDQAVELHQQGQQDPTTAEVVLHYLRYVEYFFNTGLRLVWNLHLRLELISKMQEFANKKILPEINYIKDTLAASETPEAAEIQKIKEMSKALVKILGAHTEHHRQIMINKETPGPRHFSKACKSKGISFEEIVKRHQLKLVREKELEYSGPFEELETGKRIEVFDDMVVSSGKASLLTDKGALFLDGLGITILLLSVGLMAWDVYSSDHKVETAMIDGAQLVGSMVGSFGGEFIGAGLGATLATTTIGTETVAMIATAVGMEVGAVSSSFICLTAVVTGFGAAIALGILTGWLVYKIFETGGKHASKVVTAQGQKTQNTAAVQPKIGPSVARMPDGNKLAYHLAYHRDAN